MRHIKHQRQIQAFLIEEFDESKGAALFRLQEETLDALLKSEKTYPKARWKHYLRWFCRASRCTRLWPLLPKRTPMHSHENTCWIKSVRRTMPPPQKWKQYLDFIYSHIFLKIMRTSDLWKSDQAHRNDSFDITIHACLWHTACIQHGCAVFFATLTTWHMAA